jgi:hypothetical protein
MSSAPRLSPRLVTKGLTQNEHGPELSTAECFNPTPLSARGTFSLQEPVFPTVNTHPLSQTHNERRNTNQFKHHERRILPTSVLQEHLEQSAFRLPTRGDWERHWPLIAEAKKSKRRHEQHGIAIPEMDLSILDCNENASDKCTANVGQDVLVGLSRIHTLIQ